MKVKIEGTYIDFFSSLSINYKLDASASVFSLGVRFDPNNAFHRRLFEPLAYKKVEIFTNDNDLLLTGNIVNWSLKSTSVRTIQQLSGYSITGILEDCSIPYSSYPLEKNKVSLKEIVKSLLTDFKLDFLIDKSVKSDMNLEFEKVIAQPSESVKTFITKLASQKNIILGHTKKGELFFFRPDTNAKPKRFFNQENTLKMDMQTSGQNLHSNISVIRQPNKDNTSSEPADTVKNPLVFASRSIVKILSSGTETKKTADRILASELKNIVFNLELEKIDHNLKCGHIIEVQNPEIFLYNRTKLLIESIAIKQNEKSEIMTLKLVLPETFTGSIPKNIFKK